MNAHQRYVKALVAGLAPADVARLVGDPPGNRSRSMSAADIHGLVRTHGLEETVAKWLDLLADAADPKHRGDGWDATWAGAIATMIFDLPVPDELVEAGELRAAA
jgi:hypothetical protein